MIVWQKRDGTGDQARCRSGVAAANDCSASRRREPLPGAGRELHAARAQRAELLAVAMRLLEVVTDDLVELGRALAGAVLEPACEALVQVGPRLFRDAEVGGVADQDVPEAKTVLSWEDRACGLDELLPRKRHQARSDGAAVGTAHQLADRAAPELLADDGRPLDHGALVGRQAIEPCREQSMNRGRDCEVAGRRPVLGDHREQLLDEERVALRSLGNPAQQRLFDLGLASQMAEQLFGLQV